jgi:two-component system, chemotaxis family, CheB/CheR fusion protein
MGSGKHHIVAIGASAGGLEAIHEFFDNTPERQNISYVIIQHLSPDYKSLLVELVSRHTEMKVYEAVDNTTVEKNCIYVIPNNKLITIKGDKLCLEEKGTLKVPNNAIDIFLYSLAKEKKEDAIAIILSGTGTDGTKGIEAVKKNNGLVIVQDPSTAKFDGMPNSAIHSGNVDFVLAPSVMHEEITNFTNDELAEVQLTKSINDEVLERIFRAIHRIAGFDFNYYKTPTIIRRIQRRMMRGNFKNINAYVKHLETDQEECRQLGKDFLIGVTKFFRDTGAFNFLEKNIVTDIVAAKEYGEVAKVWVAACSTGEEAYSIAILFNEVIEKSRKNIDLKIFATDLEESNIEIASRGIYPESIEKDIEQAILNKYFVKAGKSYVIIPKIRKQIVFANHNIIKDPPFIKNDLVSCRNMLIYMNPVLQQRVYSLLLFSVKRDGYLFFGSSENPSYVKDSVIEVHSKWKVYKKISETKLSVGNMDFPERSSSARSLTRKTSLETSMQTHLWEDFRRVLMEEMIFAALYIDQNFDVKEAIGNYEKILTLPKKTLRLNILRMVPHGLSAVLSSAINKAWKNRENVLLKNVRYEDAGSFFSVQVLVKPAEHASGCSMVVFSNHMRVEDAPTGAFHLIDNDIHNSEYVRSLENELIEARNNLQIVVEDLETVNEELQSSNEELLSANEELQSSNEELQSLNEELHTLNTEHQLKIKELIELNDDLNNYFASTDIGQIFLTKDLRIRKFNPASAKMINFIESDLGRPFVHISTNIRHEHLMNDIQEVLTRNVIIEKEVQLVNGKNLLMRILPYVTRDKVQEGVIISFVDITTITNLNNIIRGVFNSSNSAIFAFRAIRNGEYAIEDFVVLAANHAANDFLKRPKDNLIGKSLRKEMPLLAINGMFEKYCQVVQEDRPLNLDIFIESETSWYEVSAVKMTDGFVATFNNVTEKKLAEQRLKKNYVELVSVKDNLKKLNTELESKIRERTKELSMSEERFRMVSQATNDAIWDWDLVNNKVWWGDAFEKLFGHGLESHESDRAYWAEKVHPADLQGVQESIYSIINSNEKQWSFEYRFRKSDNSYAVILDRGYVLHDEYGTPYRMLGSMLDITDLRRAKEEVISNIQQREFLAESMPLIVCTAGADFRINFINNQFEHYTGVPVKDALGNGWHTVIHRADLKVLLIAWKGALNAEYDFEREIRMKSRTGEYLWNLLRAKARLDAAGAIISWVITIIDIHAQKVLNETLERKVAQRTLQLQRTNEELEASNHDLQQFASVASHDLQEPLRKIHMFSKLIRDKHRDVIPPDAQQHLEKIMLASARMKSIITNVLNFSRLSADDNNFEKVDLQSIITEITDDLEVAIKERNAVVKVDATCSLMVVPGQIRQVFQNLISNSLKFSKPDVPPVILISTQTIAEKSFDAQPSKGGKYCRVTVTDNGIGFDDKFRDNIFHLFHRLHSKDRYEGTGIGLAIVKKIVEKHHGIITAHSQTGKGATFTIVLPLNQLDGVQKKIAYDKVDTSRG